MTHRAGCATVFFTMTSLQENEPVQSLTAGSCLWLA